MLSVVLYSKPNLAPHTARGVLNRIRFVSKGKTGQALIRVGIHDFSRTLVDSIISSPGPKCDRSASAV